MKNLGILLAIILITVALGSCLTSTQPQLKNEINTSGNVGLPKLSDVSEQSIPDIDQDNSLQKIDPEGPSISINKEIVDLNKNGQPDNGEKVKISYGAFDPDGINGINTDFRQPFIFHKNLIIFHQIISKDTVFQ